MLFLKVHFWTTMGFHPFVRCLIDLSIRNGILALVASQGLRKIVFIAAIFAAGVIVGNAISSEPEATELELHSQIAEVAWNALEKEEFLLAYSLTITCINYFGEQALQTQTALNESNISPISVDKVNDAEKSKIFSYGILNEVAACYIIQGEIFEEMDCVDQAKEVYSKTQQLPHARVWDPKQEAFWSPSEFATRRLSILSPINNNSESANIACTELN